MLFQNCGVLDSSVPLPIFLKPNMKTSGWVFADNEYKYQVLTELQQCTMPYLEQGGSPSSDWIKSNIHNDINWAYYIKKLINLYAFIKHGTDKRLTWNVNCNTLNEFSIDASFALGHC